MNSSQKNQHQSGMGVTKGFIKWIIEHLEVRDKMSSISGLGWPFPQAKEDHQDIMLGIIWYPSWKSTKVKY